MDAGQVLLRSGHLSDELLLLIHPIQPATVEVRRAPRIMVRLWGKGIQAMTIGRRVYVEQRYLEGPESRLGRLMIHELVHVRQWRDLGLFGFLIRYGLGYVKGRLRGLGHRESYMAIALEVEARQVVELLVSRGVI